MISQSIHGVEKIELSMKDRSNSNLRELRITFHGGQTMEIAFYGNTDILDLIPRSKERFFEPKEEQIPEPEAVPEHETV